MSSLHRIVRATSLGAAAILTLSASALVWTGTASAAAPDIYDMSAEAVALQTTLTDPGVPLGIPFSVGSYGASSILNSNGESSADAGAPYSPLVSSLPNTGNGVAQSTFGTGLPVVPTFPGYVSAKDPVLPSNKQNAGGYELVADAVPGKSSGRVNIGGQSATSEENNAFAFADSVAGEDGIVTRGSAGVHALSFDGILDVFNVSSFASLTRGPDGRTTPVTTTDLGTISFAGLKSGLTGDGFTALGSAPVPLDTAGLAALNGALKPAGITLTYLPEIYAYTDGSTSTGPAVDAKKDVSGVMSGALQIFFSNTSERGTTTETVTIGRVSLTATSNSLAGGVAGAAPAAAAGATGGTALPSTGTTGIDAAGLGAAGLGALPTSTAPTAAQAPAQTFIPAAVGSILPEGTTSWESFYLILAVAAASALAGAQVVRLLAVRGR
ncbi:hypothetical protein [Sporichthya polymorpha]|uniref:hypothetical protein n=1 Tax=Sporichthya polymorpha TaxID=35751 RepID=UPI0003A03000|nr:hypothetical protein [Sporichthya polymorpha]